MSYKGKFKPKNYQKYKGDPTKIIYRSLLELRFMIYCDENSQILEWNSEEIFIFYVSPKDNKWHRYFPDFYIKYKDAEGKIKQNIIEVKPHNQTKQPVEKKTPKGKITRRFILESMTYSVNQAKWKAAIEYCTDRGWEFKILTERELR